MYKKKISKPPNSKISSENKNKGSSKIMVHRTNSNSTNPFGISFKGTMIQMDVFESSAKKASENENPIESGLNKINKFVASARMATMNKIESIKQSAISFGNKHKHNNDDNKT